MGTGGGRDLVRAKGGDLLARVRSSRLADDFKGIRFNGIVCELASCKCPLSIEPWYDFKLGMR